MEHLPREGCSLLFTGTDILRELFYIALSREHRALIVRVQWTLQFLETIARFISDQTTIG
jgi:hypothetical protein